MWWFIGEKIDLMLVERATDIKATTLLAVECSTAT
jgi:hypothetical protein